MAKFELISPFPPEECVDRLRAGVLNMTSEVDGRVEYDWIRLRKRIFGRNSFQTFLTASLKAEGTGTRIRGSLGVHPLVIGFMAFWVAGVATANLLILVLTVRDGLPPGGWFIPPAMLVGGIAGIWFCRWLSRGQDRFLVDFVSRAVEATSAVELPAK